MRKDYALLIWIIVKVGNFEKKYMEIIKKSSHIQKVKLRVVSVLSVFSGSTWTFTVNWNFFNYSRILYNIGNFEFFNYDM